MQRAFKGVSVGIGIAAALLLAEFALRLRAAVVRVDSDAVLARTSRHLPPPLEPDCEKARPTPVGEIVQPSPHPDIVYGLKPNIDTCFQEIRLQTNAEGLRAPKSYARPKPPGTFRILLLGDSQTMGWGVSHEHTFGAVIRQRLSASHGGVVEVINTGVLGYNTAQQAAVFELEGAAYEPDCVVMLFISNDLEPPQFIIPEPSATTLSRSFVWDTLRRALGRTSASADLIGYDWASPAFEPSQLLPRYREMMGVDGYARALARIADVAEELGVPVVNFADLRSSPEAELIRERRQGLGIIHPPFEFPSNPALLIGPNDGHLNVAGTAEIARQMLAELEKVDGCWPPSRSSAPNPSIPKANE